MPASRNSDCIDGRPPEAPVTGGGGTDRPAGSAAPTAESTDADLALGSDLDPEADAFEQDQRDWAWVEEWREGKEPTPWGPGLAIAVFTGFLVASAVYVLSSGLSAQPLVAVAVNAVVVAGLCPALWLSRGLPVLRWVAVGAAAGVAAAWLSVLVFLA